MTLAKCTYVVLLLLHASLATEFHDDCMQQASVLENEVENIISILKSGSGSQDLVARLDLLMLQAPVALPLPTVVTGVNGGDAAPRECAYKVTHNMVLLLVAKAYLTLREDCTSSVLASKSALAMVTGREEHFEPSVILTLYINLLSGLSHCGLDDELVMVYRELKRQGAKSVTDSIASVLDYSHALGRMGLKNEQVGILLEKWIQVDTHVHFANNDEFSHEHHFLDRQLLGQALGISLSDDFGYKRKGYNLMIQVLRSTPVQTFAHSHATWQVWGATLRQGEELGDQEGAEMMRSYFQQVNLDPGFQSLQLLSWWYSLTNVQSMSSEDVAKAMSTLSAIEDMIDVLLGHLEGPKASNLCEALAKSSSFGPLDYFLEDKCVLAVSLQQSALSTTRRSSYPFTRVYPAQKEDILEHVDHPQGPNEKWILKSCRSSNAYGIRLYQQGEGRTLLEDMEKLESLLPKDIVETTAIFGDEWHYDHTFHQQQLVQFYNPNTALIDRRKFDIKAYFVVTGSQSNPRVYVFTDGLIRISTSEYNVDDTDNVWGHVTNTPGGAQKAIHELEYKATITTITHLLQELPPENTVLSSIATELRNTIAMVASTATYQHHIEHTRSQCRSSGGAGHGGERRGNPKCNSVIGQTGYEGSLSSVKLYSSDFFLTRQVEPVLLEINQSPGMGFSRPGWDEVKSEFVRTSLKLMKQVSILHRQVMQEEITREQAVTMEEEFARGLGLLT